MKVRTAFPMEIQVVFLEKVYKILAILGFKVTKSFGHLKPHRSDVGDQNFLIFVMSLPNTKHETIF